MNENNAITTAVKSLGSNRIGGYLVAYGTSNDRDMDGQYFTKDTNFELDWYTKRPVLYGHGMDPSHKTRAIGEIVKVENRDDAGLWAEAQLYEEFMYRKYVMSWLDENKLGWSSGSSPYYAQVDSSDGFIRTWPIHEGSLTLRPAQPGKTAVQSLKHYTNIKALKEAVTEMGMESYPIDKLVVDFEGTDTKDKDSEQNAKLVAEKKDVIQSEDTNRPIELTTKVIVVQESNKEEIKMANELTKDENVEEEVVEATSEVEETVEVTTTVESTATPPLAQAVPNEVDTQKSKELEIDSFISNMATDRMYSNDAVVSSDNVKNFTDKIKSWIKNRTFATHVTLDQAQQARSNSEFQKFLTDTSKSYVAKQVEEPGEDEQVKQVRQEMQQQLDALKATMGMGAGGHSIVPNADGKDTTAAASTKYSAFYQVDDMGAKANYANYGFDDLVFYAMLRDEMNARGFNKNMRWSMHEDDALYNAIFETGKDIVPQVKGLIANSDWLETDNLKDDVHAIKAFQYMGQQNGKAIKANEVVSTGLSGRGSDWVYTLPDATGWWILLEQHSLISQLNSFMMTAGSVEKYIDDETGMPSLVPEITDAIIPPAGAGDVAALSSYPVTPAGTQKVNFNARHIGQQTVISKIEIEDARIDAVQRVRIHLQNALERGMVWSIINSHNQTGNTNYGWYGAAAGGVHPGERGLAGAGFDGLIARALATGTDAHNAGNQYGGDACVDALTATRRLMNQRYYANHNMLRLVMTPERCDLLWDLEEFKRAAHYSGSWDGGSGMITMFQGTPIIKTEQMVDRNSDGQHSMTASDNDRGVMAFIRPDRMLLGIRRRMGRTMVEYGRMREHLEIGSSVRYDFQTIPNAKDPNDSGVTGGSAMVRKPVSVLYDLN